MFVWITYSGASENVWHILNVHPNSPASSAGLISDQDYIVGTDAVFSDMGELIEAHNMKPLRFHVYNAATDSCREVSVTPNTNWGGQGSMGCELGYGYLHRIPSRQTPLQNVVAVVFIRMLLCYYFRLKITA